MVKKGRGFNIAAGVLDIILSVGFLALSGLFLLIALMGASLGEIEEAIGGTAFLALFATFALVFAFVALGLFVMLLVFGILILKTANAYPEDYYKKTGRMLGFAIVMSLLFIVDIYAVATAFSIGSLISLLAFATMVGCHWAGYGMAKHASKNLEDLRQNNENAIANDVAAENSSNENNEASSADPKLEKLEKLAKLKEAGIITDEDYEKMKSKIIEE